MNLSQNKQPNPIKKQYMQSEAVRKMIMEGTANLPQFMEFGSHWMDRLYCFLDGFEDEKSFLKELTGESFYPINAELLTTQEEFSVYNKILQHILMSNIDMQYIISSYRRSGSSSYGRLTSNAPSKNKNPHSDIANFYKKVLFTSHDILCSACPNASLRAVEILSGILNADDSNIINPIVADSINNDVSNTIDNEK